MAPTLIVLALLALGVGIVVWATRTRPGSTNTGPQEADTAWNDPVTPDQTHSTPPPPSQDPQP